MSSTSQVSSKQQNGFGRLWWIGLLTILASVIVNALIVTVTRALVPVSPDFTPLQLERVIGFTAGGTLGAIIVFALTLLWAKQPARLFQRVAWVVLLVSLVPDLLLPFIKIFPGTTFAEVGALMLMHIATGLICINVLPRASN